MTTRTLQTQTRQSEILAAALSCFSEVGIEATTIEMICRRSGSSVGSVYHHFGDKAGVAAALAFEGITRYQQGLFDLVANDPDPGAAVEAMVRYHVSWIRERPDWARYLFNQFQAATEAAGEEIKAANRRLFEMLAKWIDRHAVEGRLVPMPAGVFLAVVLGPSQELSRRWLAQREAFDLESLTDLLASAARRAAGAEN